MSSTPHAITQMGQATRLGTDAGCTLEEFCGMRIAINQVEYSTGPGGPTIHIFGRDVQGRLHRIDVTGFRPYFYIPVNQAEGMPLSAEMEAEIASMLPVK